MYACSAKRPPHEVLFAATRLNLGILRKPTGEDRRNLFCSAGILPARRSRLRALPSLAKKLSSPHRLNSQTPFIRIQWHLFSISSSALSARGWRQSQDAGLPNVKDAVITSERGRGCGLAGCRIASEGSAFRPVLANPLRISTCKTKDFKPPTMTTCRKDGWGRHLSPLAVEAIHRVPLPLAPHNRSRKSNR